MSNYSTDVSAKKVQSSEQKPTGIIKKRQVKSTTKVRSTNVEYKYLSEMSINITINKGIKMTPGSVFKTEIKKETIAVDGGNPETVLIVNKWKSGGKLHQTLFCPDSKRLIYRTRIDNRQLPGVSYDLTNPEENLELGSFIDDLSEETTKAQSEEDENKLIALIKYLNNYSAGTSSSVIE